MAGMVLFTLATLAVVAWAFLGGVAGKDRGLIFKNFGTATLVLHVNDRDFTMAPQEMVTVPVGARQFPQTLRVTDTAGNLKYQREFAFSEFQHYQFYVVMDDDQFRTYTDPALKPKP
jgi:hypothetical protein